MKTRSSYRTVPLPQVAADHLAAHLARWPADLNTGVVFTNEWGAPVQTFPFSVAWAKARHTAGVADWATPHDLRLMIEQHTMEEAAQQQASTG